MMNTTAIATYLEAEVRCFHCGHNSGYLRRDQGPTPKLAVFVPSDGSPKRAVRSLTEIRCGRCQGSVFTDDFETRYVYPKVDFFDEQPRRGRPPKRLVELRRAQEEGLRSA
jgi:hypothetical protein